MNELRTGIYKHYQGGLHLLLGIARHEITKEKLVVYVPLGVHSGAALRVLHYRDFLEEVTIKGRLVPRYLYIGSDVNPAVANWYDPLSGYRGADRVDG